MTSLNDQFLKEFSEQVADVAARDEKSLYLVVQMLFGGGAYY